MKKISIMGSIADYNPVTGQFAGTVATTDRMLMAMMYDFVDGKQWRMIFAKYYKPRTIGKDSQSHCLNGYIQQICEITGNDFDMLKDYFKRQALSDGLDFNTAPDGVAVPISEVHMSTVEIGYVTDRVKLYADENDIWLFEGI